MLFYFLNRFFILIVQIDRGRKLLASCNAVYSLTTETVSRNFLRGKLQEIAKNVEEAEHQLQSILASRRRDGFTRSCQRVPLA